jgi:hypothetical protein
VATFAPPANLCATADQIADPAADVRPPGLDDAAVVPAAEFAAGEPLPARELYLVVITLPPGKCVPYESKGNQKDGAMVLIVQQGTIEYRADAYYDGPTPLVVWGDTHGTEGDVTLGTIKRLYPGDWVTHDQQVWFTYRNVGADPAVILKAVWAVQQPGSGCGGGCR